MGELTSDVENANLTNYMNEASAKVKDETKAKGWYDHVMRFYVHCAAGKPLDENYNCNTITSST